MISLYRKLKKRDDGSALVFVAISLVLLMGMAAFGVDLAWFYLNSAKIQRGADAAALAGVIHLPQSPSTAIGTAGDVAKQNSYDDDLDEVTVLADDITSNQLEVTISQEVPTFFLKVFGWDTQVITERAIAEYIPPLKLGSPENQFGNDCDQDYEDDIGSGVDCGADFWGNIHGPWTESRMGDAFAPRCQTADSGTPAGDDLSCTANGIYRPGGYLYGIESSGTFSIEFLDLAFHNTSGTPRIETTDQHRTGDRGCEDWGNDDLECGPTMVVNMWEPDSTPLDLSDNGTPDCTFEVAPRSQLEQDANYTWETHSGCMTGLSGAGTWVVQVQHKDEGAVEDRSGLNRYSIRSTSGQIFALGDFSIYNNASGGTTDFFLAEVPDYYAGKTLVIEMFDPGEFTGTGTGYLEILSPAGSGWSIFDDGPCVISKKETYSGTYSVLPGGDNGVGDPCEQATGSGTFHNDWLKFEISIPSGYTCDDEATPISGCWWKVNYDYPGSAEVQDTTTWRAYIIGNPLHLIG